MLKFNINQTKLYQPPTSSHKGQNGKLLVIGGSKLFHSSIFWSADIASRIVDIVHFTSPANENNEIIRKRIKQNFWTGIVVDWGEVESYIEEDDAVLIGPGMIRDNELSEHSENSESQISSENQRSRKSENPALRPSESLIFRRSEYSEFSEILSEAAKTDKTSVIVNTLLRKYPDKRWVIDGGALQEVEPELITQNCILTPHKKEFQRLIKKIETSSIGWGCEARIGRRQRQSQPRSKTSVATATASRYLHNATILLKGPTDIVCQGKHCVEISGGPPSLANRLWELFVHGSWRAIRRAGNPGMTKGGTGDVLAGLVAALYCKNDAWTAATVGSYVNKKAGDELYKRVGAYFNAGDLVSEVSKVLKDISS